jgi:hypothetical protein
MGSSSTPYLSVVVVSRNDNHGGNMLQRMQIFIDSISSQCSRHSLPAELIIVEWNPPEGKKSLAEELTWPNNGGFLSIRMITVPPEVHGTLEHSDRIPLFQMIGKNVGIRRASGQFILATNIDILFSEELIAFLAEKKLDAESLYRADRIDVISPFTPWKKKIFELDPESYWSAPENAIRINKKQGTISYDIPFDGLRQYASYYLYKIIGLKIRQGFDYFGAVHLNGCGDFTLLSRKCWFDLRGYAEFEIFSWNIDSLLLVSAYYSGIREIDLRPPKTIFHIEHGAGSGWTPGAGEEKLFHRIEEKGIPYLSWPDFLKTTRDIKKLSHQSRQLILNSPEWGLADIEFHEMVFR